MKKLLNLSLVLFILVPISAFPQMIGNGITEAENWVEMMQDPGVNFYDVQKAFEAYWMDKPVVKGKGWKQFKRWENYMTPRVYPSGNKIDPSFAFHAYQEYLTSNSSNKKANASSVQTNSWTYSGPSNNTIESGAGRVNFIRFQPGDTNTIYIGTPAGGLWKTNNGGDHWSTNTDQLASLGMRDLAIDPSNVKVMYLATGDADGARSSVYISSLTGSYGVLKTDDGGLNWKTTGLKWTYAQNININRVLVNPINTNIVFAAASDGLYRSMDGGAIWEKVVVGDARDIAFKPEDPSVVYVVGISSFLKSVDSGATFTSIPNNGLPVGKTMRLKIAVTAADPTYIYIAAVAGSGSNYAGFYGLYCSTNSGISFSLRSNSPNLLGYLGYPPADGGQGWYDFVLAVSPVNKNIDMCGGIVLWKSIDGGINWKQANNKSGFGEVHLDLHCLEYMPGKGSTAYLGTDGGIYKTTGSATTWTNISNGLQNAEIYGIGQSSLNSNLYLSGWQDNGDQLCRAGVCGQVGAGGDGMKCFIDWSDDKYMYFSSQAGFLLSSNDGGITFNSILTPDPGSNYIWVTPWVQDPVNPSTIYAGITQMWKSIDRGSNWSQMGNTGGTPFVAIAVAPSNTQVLYAAKQNKIYKTTNGGNLWTNVAGSLPVSAAYISNLAIDPLNSDRIWVSFSGFSASNKVYRSINGGTTWTNISAGLPNLPINCIVYQKGSKDEIYIGTDIGVYCRDASTTAWSSCMNGLPNVGIAELEIQYSAGIIRAATFGRGVWECNLLNPAAGINKKTISSSGITVYPNPTSGSIHFKITEGRKNAINSIGIYNSMGEKTMELPSLACGDQVIDIKHLPDGLYFLLFNSDEGVSVEKILKSSIATIK